MPLTTALAAPPPGAIPARTARIPLRVVIAVALPALFGVLSGLITPRGPITTGEGLATMALALVTGLLAGSAARNRWALLYAPLAFVIALELARLPVTGPTVDAIRVSTQFGFIAFATGRGVHGLLAIAPLMLGVALGAAYAKRRSGSTPQYRGLAGRIWAYFRRTMTVVLAILLAALAVGIARPASTDPIIDANGALKSGSIAELTTVHLDGKDLAVMTRGHDTDNPLLLYIAGGPGGSELGAMRRHLATLEEDFTVVTLDQRGTGKSYSALDPASTLTFDGAVRDVIELTELLHERFGAPPTYLVGQSYGSLVGVRAAQQRPDLFAAYIGVGQMVSPAETDQIIYEDTLSWARAAGRQEVVEHLSAIGYPPYHRISDYETATTYETSDVYPYNHSPNSEGAGQFSENIFVSEYTLLEQLHILGAVLDVFSIIYPQLQEVDFRTDAPTLDIPVYLMQGRFEARGRTEPAHEWFDLLNAPHKEMVLFDTSGHRPLFEQPGVFREALARIAAES